VTDTGWIAIKGENTVEIIDVETLKKQLREFSDERDWKQFHNPKNLAMALAGESGELLEIFQWLTFAESEAVKSEAKLKQDSAYELADILLYAIRLADRLEINLAEAIKNKLVINAEKYPIEKVKGVAKKYHEY
jgi:dCTP diphosphatase